MRSRKCWAFRLAPSTANGGWRAPGFTRRCTDDPRAVATHQVSVRAGARPTRGRSVALTRGDSRLAIAIAVVRHVSFPFRFAFDLTAPYPIYSISRPGRRYSRSEERRAGKE